MARRKVLVTGAFGNVGGHVVRHLVEAGDSVVTLDVHSPVNDAKQQALAKDLSFKASWIDLTDADAVGELIAAEEPEAIVHVAAIIAPTAYLIDKKAEAVNVGGTRNLLDAAAALSARPRFVFTSSYSVHGPRNPYRNLPPITGATPVDPRDTYGCHKVLAEQMVRASGLDWAIVRLPAVWSVDAGWGSSPEFLKFSFLLPEDRNETAIDARDAALALANATRRDVVGRTLNVGGAEGWSGRSSELMTALFSARGMAPIPSSAYRKVDREADDAWYYEDVVDTRESQEALDYQKHTLDEYFSAIRPSAAARVVLKVAGGAIGKRLAKGSPYYGTEQTPDTEETWTRVCEVFGIDPTLRDPLLERIARGQ